MANRKATFAKRQRETELKDRAKAKGDRRAQKRTETRDNKGPQIAWEEAVHAVTSDENDNNALPSLRTGNQDAERDPDADANTNPNPSGPPAGAAPGNDGPPSPGAAPTAPTSPTSPSPRG